MPHKVFICYASQDKAIAEAVCDALESRHIQCWIAPRDVLPGMEWAETIVDALDESHVIVLVLSTSSNNSPQVIREIGRAAGKGIPIIPFVIEDVSLSKAMDYFISRHQFMDAITPPLEKHLQRLTDTLEKTLSREHVPDEGSEVSETEEKAKREAEEARKAEEVTARAKEEEEAARGMREADEAARDREAEEKASKKAEKEAKERQAEPVKVKVLLLKRWWLWGGVVGIVAASVLISLFVFVLGETAEQHYSAGVVLLEEGQYEQAVLEFSEAIELNPNYAVAYYNRGFSYFYQDDYNQALIDLTKALELDPAIEVNHNYSIAYYDRGLSYLDQGEYNQAIADLTKALELDPTIEVDKNYAVAYHDQGLAYSNEGDYDQAIADFNRALELKPYTAEYYNARGYAYYQIGDPDMATSDFEKCIELSYDPDEIQYAGEWLGQIVASLLPSEPTYEDDFSNPASDWTIVSSEDREFAYENGQYHIRVKTSDLAPWTQNWMAGQSSDFALEIDARLASGPATGAYGVVFRIKNNDNFYCFLVRGNGYYFVKKWINAEWSTLQDWTKSDFINQGYSTNHLMVVCQVNKIRVYVNGSYLATITDNTFTKGYVGLMLSSNETDAHAAFDNIKVYRLD